MEIYSFSSGTQCSIKQIVKKRCWSTDCDESLNKIKEVLSSAKVLAHSAPKVPIAVACEASKVGIGAVLYHSYDNGTERLIAYASKAFTKAEQYYSETC